VMENFFRVAFLLSKARVGYLSEKIFRLFEELYVLFGRRVCCVNESNRWSCIKVYADIIYLCRGEGRAV